MHQMLLDSGSLYDRGLAELKPQGCKRIAMIRSHKSNAYTEAELTEALKRNDMLVPDYLHHQLSISSAPAVANLVHLMFLLVKFFQ